MIAYGSGPLFLEVREMYSVVLLMAMSGSADAPAFGGGCCGGFNLFGGSCSGCCGGCTGYSCDGCCGGCCGGKMFGGGGMKLFGGHGCCGGCCGGSCSGCCGGSCHGCCGGSCHGCCGGSCHGCCGGGGLFSKMKEKWGSCHGCCGGSCHGCCGGCCGGCGGVVVGGHAMTTTTEMPKAEGTTTSAPATIVVNVPAEAKLLIDGNATTSTSERRVFVSPSLEPEQEYYYTVQVEHKGETKTERVAVRAGQEVNVKIEFPSSVAVK